MKNRRRAGLLVIGMLLLGTASMIGLRSERVNQRLVPPAATLEPVETPESLSETEMAFYAQVGAPLRVAAAESERLAELGEAHSRNIFELQSRSNRLTGAMDEIDRVLSRTGTPERFAASLATYRRAEVEVQATIAAAKQAFSTFDFAALGAAVTGFRAGADLLATASLELERAAGVPSPAEAATP